MTRLIFLQPCKKILKYYNIEKKLLSNTSDYGINMTVNKLGILYLMFGNFLTTDREDQEKFNFIRSCLTIANWKDLMETMVLLS